VLELDGFGRVLVTDSFTQSAEVDEFIYHEALVHPAMCLHPNPKTVFIGGGGEMATAREVLRHKSVEKVVMVDIDQELVEFSREHLPEWGGSCWEDKRLEVHYEDARAYLQRCKKEYKQSFDVVIMDICDPTRDSLAVKLYEEEFYRELQTCGALNEGFVLVTQSGPGGTCSVTEVGSVIHNTMSKVYKNTLFYYTTVSSFFDNWCFNLSFDTFDEKKQVDPRKQSTEGVDKLLAERLNPDHLRFYDGQAHRGIFGLPKHIAAILKKETRVLTEKTPVFMNSEYEQPTGEFVEM